MPDKKREHFEDFVIGEQFIHNKFTYRKVSTTHGEVFDPLLHLRPVRRFFNGPTKVRPVEA